jgi:DNA-binding CsgD family transcriptional regulator
LEKKPYLYDDPTVLVPLMLEVPAAAAWLARVALAADDRERAVAVVTAAERLTSANPGLASLASASIHARGVLDGDPAALLVAAEAHQHTWSGASAAEDAGATLVASSDRSGARGALEKAFTAYERIGAERDLARVRARLRAVGVRRCHWSHEARPVSGWASLTETEMNVASLVAESLTNPQVAERMFLSRHTVDFHLRQIFRKLGIESRVALTRLVLEQRMDERPTLP